MRAHQDRRPAAGADSGGTHWQCYHNPPRLAPSRRIGRPWTRRAHWQSGPLGAGRMPGPLARLRGSALQASARPAKQPPRLAPRPLNRSENPPPPLPRPARPARGAGPIVAQTHRAPPGRNHVPGSLIPCCSPIRREREPPRPGCHGSTAAALIHMSRACRCGVAARGAGAFKSRSGRTERSESPASSGCRSGPAPAPLGLGPGAPPAPHQPVTQALLGQERFDSAPSGCRSAGRGAPT